MYYLFYFGLYTGNIIPSAFSLMLKNVYTNTITDHKWDLSPRMKIFLFREEEFGIKLQRCGHPHLILLFSIMIQA